MVDREARSTAGAAAAGAPLAVAGTLALTAGALVLATAGPASTTEPTSGAVAAPPLSIVVGDADTVVANVGAIRTCMRRRIGGGGGGSANWGVQAGAIVRGRPLRPRRPAAVVGVDSPEVDGAVGAGMVVGTDFEVEICGGTATAVVESFAGAACLRLGFLLCTTVVGGGIAMASGRGTAVYMGGTAEVTEAAMTPAGVVLKPSIAAGCWKPVGTLPLLGWDVWEGKWEGESTTNRKDKCVMLRRSCEQLLQSAKAGENRSPPLQNNKARECTQSKGSQSTKKVSAPPLCCATAPRLARGLLAGLFCVITAPQ